MDVGVWRKWTAATRTPNRSGARRVGLRRGRPPRPTLPRLRWRESDRGHRIHGLHPELLAHFPEQQKVGRGCDEDNDLDALANLSRSLDCDLEDDYPPDPNLSTRTALCTREFATVSAGETTMALIDWEMGWMAI